MMQFQSTRPVWGATVSAPDLIRVLRISIHAPRVGRDTRHLRRLNQVSFDFNPRAPCGARHPFTINLNAIVWISIHAPRVGRDDHRRRLDRRRADFNPRAPCGARRILDVAGTSAFYFNPRAPCGARQRPSNSGADGRTFQSTRPVWGATICLIGSL